MKKTRKEILEINPAFTKFVLDLQLSYKPEPYEVGDRVDSESYGIKGYKDGVAVLTKDLVAKLNIEQDQEFENNRDKNPNSKSVDLQFIESRLIISSKKKTHEYLNDIAKSIESIRLELDETALMIIGVQNIPWLYQENDYLPVKNALNYLKDKIDRDFDGGFILKEGQILELIPHLFWLIRCNASLSPFYFSFPKSQTMLTICKYGVLHLEFYNQKEKITILKLLSKMNFKEIDSCNDPIEFDGFDGRRIKINS